MSYRKIGTTTGFWSAVKPEANYVVTEILTY